MFTKEETNNLRILFWENFKKYCSKNKVRRRWLLKNISVNASQLKFDVNRDFAMVSIQVDNKKEEIKYKIYDYWKSYKIVIEEITGSDLSWERDYITYDNRKVGLIYFKLDGVDILKQSDHEKIYDFFVEKMTLIENAYLEIKDSLVENIKNN